MSEIVVVKITDLSRAGSGVARLESGEVVFVPYTAPGDEVKVEITDRKKNYLHAKVLEIVRPASERVTPPCPVFTECGGCSWQHLPYDLQFETKKKGLLHALSRGGVQVEGIPLDAMPAKNQYSYRNRVQLHGAIEGQKFGFYARGSKTIVPIENCAIADIRVNESLPRLKKEGFGIHKADFRVEVGINEINQIQAAWNQPNAALGFRQVNDEQNKVLQKWVAEHIEDADVLLDLYGGAANLSLSLTSRFKTVHCVDIRVPQQSTVPNLQFHRGGVAHWLQEFKLHGSSVSLVLDPPREGLSHDFPKIAQALEKMPVKSLILVGCDVDAFVRDTHRLIQSGFQLKRLGALDLFPQTPHVESLALFTR